MKKFALAVFSLFIFLSAFSEFLITREYRYFNYIDYLSKAGLIELHSGDIPVKSEYIYDQLIPLLSEEMSNSERMVISLLLDDLLNYNIRLCDKVELGINNAGFHASNNIMLYTGRILPHLSAQAGFKSVYPYSADSTMQYRIKPWNNSYSYLSEASITYGYERSFISIGRFSPRWGTGLFDNMFFSDSIFEFDGLLLSLKKGIFSFSYFTTVLTPYNYVFNDSLFQTYASFHKIAIDLPFRNSLNLKEGIIYSSILPEPYYFNPFLVYYFTQWNSKNDNNILWSIQLTSRTFSPFEFNGELFIDDFQYEKPITNPNKLGMLISGHMPVPGARNIIVGLEYARILKWTGTHEYDNLKYAFNREPIMYFIGPDADLTGLYVKYIYGTLLNINAGALLCRQGEGSMSVSYEEEGGDINPDFPSGVVINTWKYYLDFEITFGRHLGLNINTDFRYIQNAGHISGTTDNIFNINIEGVVYL